VDLSNLADHDQRRNVAREPAVVRPDTSHAPNDPPYQEQSKLRLYALYWHRLESPHWSGWEVYLVLAFWANLHYSEPRRRRTSFFFTSASMGGVPLHPHFVVAINSMRHDPPLANNRDRSTITPRVFCATAGTRGGLCTTTAHFAPVTGASVAPVRAGYRPLWSADSDCPLPSLRTFSRLFGQTM